MIDKLKRYRMKMHEHDDYGRMVLACSDPAVAELETAFDNATKHVALQDGIISAQAESLADARQEVERLREFAILARVTCNHAEADPDRIELAGSVGKMEWCTNCGAYREEQDGGWSEWYLPELHTDAETERDLLRSNARELQADCIQMQSDLEDEQRHFAETKEIARQEIERLRGEVERLKEEAGRGVQDITDLY